MSQDDYRKNHTCSSCTQLIDSRDLASMQCGHPFHYQCLQVTLAEQIHKHQYPLCCPISQCFVEPSMYFLSVVLEDPEFQGYLILEKNSVQAFETYECPFCEQTFLAYQSNKVHKCLKCYKVICLLCGDGVHPNQPCQKVPIQEKPQIQEPLKSPTSILSSQPEGAKQIQLRSLSNKKRPTIEIPSSPSAQSNNKEFDNIQLNPKKTHSRKQSAASPSPMAATNSLTSKKNSFISSSNAYQSGNVPLIGASQIFVQPEKNILQNKSRDYNPGSLIKNPSLSLMKSHGSKKSFDKMSSFIQQNGDDTSKFINQNSNLKYQSSLLQQKISC